MNAGIDPTGRHAGRSLGRPGSGRARARVVAPALLLGALVFGGGWLFLSLCEPVVKTVKAPRSDETHRNPLLAAERVLDRLGYPTSALHGDLRLPPTDHVLFLFARTLPATRLRYRELLRWVKQGGRLVVTPIEHGEAPHAEPDPLLAAFGVKVKGVPPPPGAAPRATTDGAGNDDGEEVIELPLEPVLRHARVAVPRSPRLIDSRQTADDGFTDDAGAVLLTFDYGKGDITILSSAVYFNNARIADRDAAALVLWLVLGKTDPRGVDFSLHDEMPSLATLLVRHAWTALIPALLLTAALAWRAAARFGPLAPAVPAERRSLLEHLEAAARWLWLRGEGSDRRGLVDAVRRAVRERVEARQPAWSKLPEPELIQRLGAAAALPPQVVAEALHGPAGDDEARFVATVQTLAQLRRSL